MKHTRTEVPIKRTRSKVPAYTQTFHEEWNHNANETTQPTGTYGLTARIMRRKMKGPKRLQAP